MTIHEKKWWALHDAHEVKTEEKFFATAPFEDTAAHRVIFDHGFSAGWNAALLEITKEPKK